MLPFDNKSEFLVILDMPEHAALEQTARAALQMADYLKTVNEVTDLEIYIGTAAPFNFNGLVSHYYLRSGPTVADLQVNLAAKHHRKAQSHEIAKRVRSELKAIVDRFQARVKVAEVPPGPPVLSTVVAEIYGPDYERLRALAWEVLRVLTRSLGGGHRLVIGRRSGQGQSYRGQGKGGLAWNQRSSDQPDSPIRREEMEVGLLHQPQESGHKWQRRIGWSIRRFGPV